MHLLTSRNLLLILLITLWMRGGDVRKEVSTAKSYVDRAWTLSGLKQLVSNVSSRSSLEMRP